MKTFQQLIFPKANKSRVTCTTKKFSFASNLNIWQKQTIPNTKIKTKKLGPQIKLSLSINTTEGSYQLLYNKAKTQTLIHLDSKTIN